MINIYKASAGSGKTFRLVLEYLTMLLGEKREDGTYRLRTGSGRSHRAILAITFTNKATEEMKRRIIQELAVLAGMEPEWEKPSPYLKELCRRLNTTPELLRVAAAKALSSLLYDFGFFNVSTIDAFFQTVLRTFAREAELTGNFELELDRDYVIDMSIDRLLSEVSRENVVPGKESPRLKWIIEYMEQMARDKKDFNIFNRNSTLYSSLVKLAKEMLDDDFAENAALLTDYLSDPGRISRFTRALTSETNELLKIAKACAAKVVELIETGSDGFADPSPFLKVAALSEFNKWNNLTSVRTIRTIPAIVSGYKGDAAVFFKATDLKKKKLTPDDFPELGRRMGEAVEAIRECLTHALPSIAIQDNIYMVGLLGDVIENMRQYCSDNNIFLLSDTNDLLRRIIADDDVPFVYERIGVWINHFLIDEFQDTSRMQWKNLRPLLHQSVGTNNDNLIIGDEKQCIYRFRNSDPDLLHSAVQADFPHGCDVTGDKPEENTNWRSSAEVVTFNNRLFQAMASKLGAAEIYANVGQNIADDNRSKHGYVKVTPIEEDFETRSLEVLVENLKRQLQTYKPGDITILTRYNNQAARVIDHLLSLTLDPESGFPAVNIISDDSLYIEKSPAVRFILSALRYLVASDTASDRKKSRRRLAAFFSNYEYARTRRGMEAPDAVRYAAESDDCPFDALAAEYRTMQGISLVSLVEEIVRDYVTPEARDRENMFIAAFVDLVIDFTQRGNGDVQSFLSWWDDTGSKSTVSSPADDNAIRVMTIHKSKGLESRCVHVPFATWAIEKENDIHWHHLSPAMFPAIDPADIPPMVPVKSAKWLEKTPFGERYCSFVEQQRVDELNIAYVAFTRAINELIVQCNVKEKSTLGHYLTEALPVTPAVADPDGSYSLGSPTVAGESAKKKKMALDPDTSDGLTMPAYASLPREDIWSQLTLLADDDPGATTAAEARERGVLLHNIMGTVYKAADIPDAVGRMAARGLLRREEVDETVAMLAELVAMPEVIRWFDGSGRVLLERPIMTADRTFRPDRVVWTADGTIDVIDYKTGSPHPGYAAQVRRYASLLRQAGHENVKGYLWYLDTGRVVSVC